MGSEPHMEVASTGLDMPNTNEGLIRIAQGRHADPPGAQRALEEICVQYREPVLEYLKRRCNPGEAGDLCHDLLLKLLECGIDSYDGRRARFRAWLVGCMRNVLRRSWRTRSRDRKRLRSLDGEPSRPDAAVAEPRDASDPAREAGSHALADAIDSATRQVQASYASKGQTQRFDALHDLLPCRQASSEQRKGVAAELGISHGALRKASHDLRKHYRRAIQEAIEDVPVGMLVGIDRMVIMDTEGVDSRP